jgi:hypothetical protein
MFVFHGRDGLRAVRLIISGPNKKEKRTVSVCTVLKRAKRDACLLALTQVTEPQALVNAS